MATCRRARCKPGSAGLRCAALGSATARGDGEGGRVRFTSAILPPYLRRAHSVEELLPCLYLKGISTGDFAEALEALPGPGAPGLSASTITRLKASWAEDHERWNRRDLSARRYVYFWGRHLLQAAPGPRQTMPAGDHRCRRGRPQGYRRGLRRRPRERAELARGSARPEAPRSALRAGVGRRRRRARLLEGAAQGLRPNGRAALLGTQDRQRPEQYARARHWSERPRERPKACRATPRPTCGRSGWPRPRRTPRRPSISSPKPTAPRYDKAVACLTRDRERLLTFHQFPAEHGKHPRSTNPIESPFATVRHRTGKTKGCLSRKSALAMVFKFLLSAKKSWAQAERVTAHHRRRAEPRD